MVGEYLSDGSNQDTDGNGNLSDEPIEELVCRRKELHDKLQVISINLCEVTADYNACIVDIIKVNEALKNRGYDCDALANELQQAS